MNRTTATIRSDLKEATANHGLVRILRTIPRGDKLEGFVLDVGSQWLLLHVLSSDVFLNGHAALRVSDVRSVKPLGITSFWARALKHYAENPRRPGRVNLTSTRTVVETLARRFPLITIHTERRDPNVCYIGIPDAITSQSLRLREITPEARWENESTTYRLKEITRVEIGGRYEAALLAVGGLPTKVRRS